MIKLDPMKKILEKPNGTFRLLEPACFVLVIVILVRRYSLCAQCTWSRQYMYRKCFGFGQGLSKVWTRFAVGSIKGVRTGAAYGVRLLPLADPTSEK